MIVASRLASLALEASRMEADESSNLNTIVDSNNVIYSRSPILHNQQFRLFLLHHASCCTKRHGKCKYVYCTVMKDLLKHMGCCNDAACTVRHCLKSRVLLNHFNRCEDQECIQCVSVREAIMDEHWEGVKRKLEFPLDDEDDAAVHVNESEI
jgi:hypothetical protein